MVGKARPGVVVAVKAGLGEEGSTGGFLWNQDLFLFLRSKNLSGRCLFILDLTLFDLLNLAIRIVITMNRTVLVAELAMFTVYQYAPEFSQLESSLLMARLIKLLQELRE